VKSLLFSTYIIYHLLILKTGSTRNTTSKSWTTMPTIPHKTCLISEGMNTRLSLALKAWERPRREKGGWKNTQRERHKSRERTQKKEREPGAGILKKTENQKGKTGTSTGQKKHRHVKQQRKRPRTRMTLLGNQHDINFNKG
jgi:hypothetical protein